MDKEKVIAKFKVGDEVIYSKYNPDFGGENGYLRLGMIGTVIRVDSVKEELPYAVSWDNPKTSKQDNLEGYEIELLSKLHKALK